MSTGTGLGARLRWARERAGLSQQQAAEALGVAREVVSYWENERRIPGPPQLTRLSAAYGVTTGHLSGREPAPARSADYALLYRSLGAQPQAARDTARRWLEFLDDWATILEDRGRRLPGRGTPPRELVREDRTVTDSRRAPALAERARHYYQLGLDAIPDLFAFLDQRGVLVYRAPLGRVGDSGDVSGIFYNHPRLGYCVCVNTDTTRGRQFFTLAHEFSHALFHHAETGLVSRAGSTDLKEKFADAFAGHFLVPTAALRALNGRSAGERAPDPFLVIRLQRYFRVSYATMLVRFYAEGFLTREQYEEYREYSPSHLAAQLGLDTCEYHHHPKDQGVTLSAYPTSILELTRAFLRDRTLDLPGAAALFRVPEETIATQLLSRPREADPDERREFEELPVPPAPRRRRRTA